MEKGSLLPLPFPIFNLVHVQYICFVVQMISCLSEQLFSLIPTFSYGVALATELLLQVMANGVRHFAQNRF